MATKIVEAQHAILDRAALLIEENGYIIDSDTGDGVDAFGKPVTYRSRYISRYTLDGAICRATAELVKSSEISDTTVYNARTRIWEIVPSASSSVRTRKQAASLLRRAKRDVR